MSAADFPVRLGASFANPPAESYCTLRYEFLPASAAAAGGGGRGRLAADAADGAAAVHLPAGGGGELAFTGRWAAASAEGGDVECVAFFEGDHYRLERVAARAAGLRHAPPSRQLRRRHKGAAPAPAAAAAAEGDAAAGAGELEAGELEAELLAALDEGAGAAPAPAAAAARRAPAPPAPPPLPPAAEMTDIEREFHYGSPVP